MRRASCRGSPNVPSVRWLLAALTWSRKASLARFDGSSVVALRLVESLLLLSQGAKLSIGDGRPVGIVVLDLDLECLLVEPLSVLELSLLPGHPSELVVGARRTVAIRVLQLEFQRLGEVPLGLLDALLVLSDSAQLVLGDGCAVPIVVLELDLQ